MKKYFYLLISLLVFSSCDKFLEIQPEDKFTEDMVYNNGLSIQQAINGIYNDMAHRDLYGANLTSTTVELFAQRYRTSAGSHQYLNYQTYAYTQADVQDTVNRIWTSAYQRILELNVFIEKLGRSQNVINSVHKDILLGEAKGLRAMMHFDLLRLYGPIYKSADSTAISIPYNTKAQNFETPLLPANNVMDSIQRDLYTAISLLKEDPIITQGTMDELQFDGQDFYRFRNRRMNLYAVKALLARTHLYRREHVQANRVAKEVLMQSEQWFPWIQQTEIIAATQPNPDRIFSKEVLFGLINNNLYLTYDKYFGESVIEQAILAPLSTRLANIFESNGNDFRYTISNTWRNYGSKPYLLFCKFEDVTDKESKFRLFQPLIRKSELYYILAETETDPTAALNYLNAVRTKRGLVALATAPNLIGEIQKEYQKEFFGEGQLFFYYKRQNLASIPNANTLGTVVMNASKYVVPLPLSETDHR